MSRDPGVSERAPLGSLDALASPPWSPWPLPDVVSTTPSTMGDVERRAREGAPEGTVVVAEEQTAGRGRRGRSWESVARAGLWWSLLLRPQVPADRLGWLPLVVGVGVARGIGEATGQVVELKWPNDVVVGDRKLAGILAERLADGAIVVGVGINVDQRPDETPEGGTSMRILGLQPDRTVLLAHVLAHVAEAYREWVDGADPEPAYIALSATIGRDVRADLGDRTVDGRAVGLGASGELIVSRADGTHLSVTAADVAMVRPAT